MVMLSSAWFQLVLFSAGANAIAFQVTNMGGMNITSGSLGIAMKDPEGRSFIRRATHLPCPFRRAEMKTWRSIYRP